MRDSTMEPRLQDSYGSSGCSPHGFVAVMRPMCGVGLSRFTRSRKIIPGSPLRHAPHTISENTFRASRSVTCSPVSGSQRTELLSPAAMLPRSTRLPPRSTASMKASSTPTEML